MAKMMVEADMKTAPTARVNRKPVPKAIPAAHHGDPQSPGTQLPDLRRLPVGQHLRETLVWTRPVRRRPGHAPGIAGHHDRPDAHRPRSQHRFARFGPHDVAKSRQGMCPAWGDGELLRPPLGAQCNRRAFRPASQSSWHRRGTVGASPRNAGSAMPLPDARGRHGRTRIWSVRAGVPTCLWRQARPSWWRSRLPGP